MKRNILLLAAVLLLLTATAQKATYKVFERKRGTAYTPYMVGADSDYIYVHVPGISESAQSRNTDASLSAYRTKDLTLAKKIEADFDYEGEDVYHSDVYLTAKYVLLIFRTADKKSPDQNRWVALEKGTLKPLKKGSFAKGLEAVGEKMPQQVAISPDRKITVMVTGYKERKSAIEYAASCFDENLNLLWETKFDLPSADYQEKQIQVDNNHNLYLLAQTKYEAFARSVAPEYRLVTIKNDGKTKDNKPVEVAGKFPFSISMSVSGEGDVYIGGPYGATNTISPDGIFSQKISHLGPINTDVKPLTTLKEKTTNWVTRSSLTDKNEFCFNVNRYVASTFENTTTNYICEYVVGFTSPEGKLTHQMVWHHYATPSGNMQYGQTVLDGKPYLFTEYAQEQLDDWGKKKFSTEETSARERGDALTHQIYQVIDVDHPDEKKPHAVFHLDKTFFSCSSVSYEPSIKTMIFFGFLTKGQYAQGWTNFYIGKMPLIAQP